MERNINTREQIKSQLRVWLIVAILMVGDLIAIYLSFASASSLRESLVPWMGGQISWTYNLPIVYLAMAFCVVLHFAFDLYPGYGLTAVKEIERSVYSSSLIFGILGVTIYFLKVNLDFPRSVFLIAWAFSLISVPILRIIIRNRISLLSWYGISVIFVIENSNDLPVLEAVQNCRRLGWKPAAVLVRTEDENMQDLVNVEIVYSLKDLLELSKANAVDTVIIASKIFSHRPEIPDNLLRVVTGHFQSIILVSRTFELGATWIEPRDLEGYLGLELRYNLLNSSKRLLKRLIDVLGTAVLIILVSPIWILITLLIKLDSDGSVYYIHPRIGKSGKPFGMYKFRTMVVNADQQLDSYLAENPTAKQEWEEYQKLSHDPRITRLGKWLRKFSLDEIPQFWNVLKGEMSLIGPRAVTDEELKKFDEYASIILRVKPGITGWWQVMGRNQTTWAQRKRLEVYYVSNWSLLMDAYITLKTIWVIISGKGR